MKKISSAFALLVFMSSCSLLRQPAVLTSGTLDYSEYQKQGFFLSESNSVSFPYEPIASVSALQLSGYKIKQSGTKEFRDDTFQTSYSKDYVSTSNEFEAASKSKVLEELVRSSKVKGANGLINLKIEPVITVTKEGYTKVSGYSGTGMAIKK